MSSPHAEDMLDFLNSVTELGPGYVLIYEEIFVHQILGPENIHPETLLPSIEPPDPLGQETNIHNPRVYNT
jgi:hypothetical protein